MAIKILRVTFLQPVNLGSQGKGSLSADDVKSITRQPDGVLFVPKAGDVHTFVPLANISSLAFSEVEAAKPEAKK